MLKKDNPYIKQNHFNNLYRDMFIFMTAPLVTSALTWLCPLPANKSHHTADHWLQSGSSVEFLADYLCSVVNHYQLEMALSLFNFAPDCFY